MNIIAAIERRYSVRHYEKRPVPRDIIRQVISAGRDAYPLCPGIRVHWHIAWAGEAVRRRLARLVTSRGLSTPAPHYIIATSQERSGFMENLGFCMEQLILTATAMGLGTCWIGGMFTEERLRDLVPRLRTGERIIAITPLGYVDSSPRARMARRLLLWGSDRMGSRKPLRDIVSQDIWPVPWTGGDENLEWIFQMTRLAPSWANTQPWRFIVAERQVIATVNSVPQRGNIREGKPYYRLDGGIAMCHFFLAAQAMRWPGQWTSLGNERAPRRGEDRPEQMQSRYGIPDEYEILGTFPLPDSISR